MRLNTNDGPTGLTTNVDLPLRPKSLTIKGQARRNFLRDTFKAYMAVLLNDCGVLPGENKTAMRALFYINFRL